MKTAIFAFGLIFGSLGAASLATAIVAYDLKAAAFSLVAAIVGFAIVRCELQ